MKILVIGFLVSFALGIMPPVAIAQTSQACISTPPPAELPVAPDLSSEAAASDFTYENFAGRVADVMVEYLNLGVSVEQINALWEEFSLWPVMAHFDQRVVVFQDVTGDGWQDAVLLVEVYILNAHEFVEVIIVAQCGGGDEKYTAVGSASYLSLESPASTLFAVQDLDADGTVEILVQTQQCGAHTCTATPHLLTFDETGLHLAMEDLSDEFVGYTPGWSASHLWNDLWIATATFEITDTDRDGLYTIKISGEGYGSAGAGLYQPEILTITYDVAAGAWVWNYGFAPAEYLIHMVHDGDRAALQGDFTLAIEYYTRAVFDNTLIVNPYYGGGEAERGGVEAYAYYRMVVSYLQVGNRTRAQTLYDEMVRAGTDPAMIELAVLMLEAETVAEGCAAVRARAESEGFPAALNGYGYANPEYGVHDICPF